MSHQRVHRHDRHPRAIRREQAGLAEDLGAERVVRIGQHGTDRRGAGLGVEHAAHVLHARDVVPGWRGVGREDQPVTPVSGGQIALIRAGGQPDRVQRRDREQRLRVVGSDLGPHVQVTLHDLAVDRRAKHEPLPHLRGRGAEEAHPCAGAVPLRARLRLVALSLLQVLEGDDLVPIEISRAVEPGARLSERGLRLEEVAFGLRDVARGDVSERLAGPHAITELNIECADSTGHRRGDPRRVVLVGDELRGKHRHDLLRPDRDRVHRQIRELRIVGLQPHLTRRRHRVFRRGHFASCPAAPKQGPAHESCNDELPGGGKTAVIRTAHGTRSFPTAQSSA